MEVAAGGAHFLSLLQGDVYAWGGNEYGQLGDEAEVVRPRPMLVMREVIAVACGWNHSLAITRYRECVCWGANSSGQLGNGTQGDRGTPVQVLDNVVGIAGGAAHSLAVVDVPGLSTTACYAWGANVSDGNTTACVITRVGHLALEPMKVQHLKQTRRLAAGRNHSLVIKKGGDLFSWGRNTYGQLGRGTTLHERIPQKVMENVRAAAAGMDFSVAVLRRGECYAWGRNRNGQVGDGTTMDRFTPVKVLDGVRTVVAGHGHVLAILGDGDCVSWGRNLSECVCSPYEWGRPGDVRSPVRVSRDVSLVLAAESQSIALLKTGEYQVWGRNWSGIAQSLSTFGAMAYLRQAPAAGPVVGDLSHVVVEDDEVIWEPGKPETPTDDVDPELYAAFFGKKAPPKQDVEEEQARETAVAPAESDEEPDLGDEEAHKAYIAADALWFQATKLEHGEDVHGKVHSRALAQGRPYALRWAAFRKKRVEELMSGGVGVGSARAARTSRSPRSGNHSFKSANLPRELELTTDLQNDQEVLQQFHADLWKAIFRYKREKKESKGNDAFIKAWPAEDHDIFHGLEVLERSMRKASKAVIKKEELFGTPPLTPRTKKEQKKKEKAKNMKRQQRRYST